MTEQELTDSGLEEWKKIIESARPKDYVEPKRYGSLYYLPPDDGDTEHDRLRDIQLSERTEREEPDLD
jgi:hypothetical protein